MPEFKREHFVRVELDVYHHYYSFRVPGFELCLEPCAAGFDVAIYAENMVISPEFKVAMEPKRCTETGDYTVSPKAMLGVRSDEDWNRALEIADEMLGKYTKYRASLKEELCHMSDVNKIKGNDLITEEEVVKIRAGAKTITMQQAIAMTSLGKVMVITPTPLKSGYCVSFSKIEGSPGMGQIELCSVGIPGKLGKLPDHADADYIVLAVLGKGYTPIVGLKSKMLHYWKRRGL